MRPPASESENRTHGAEKIEPSQYSTYSTWGNSGIEPNKAQGISSSGTYEASLMWPRNDGERQWNIMLDWTCR